MTMTEAGASAPVVFDDKGLPNPVEIHGKRIGFGTSRRDTSRKWATVEIWKLDDGGYMAHRVGYSLVYHRHDTWCKTRSGGQPGAVAAVDDLPDDADPCEDCKPVLPEYLGDDDEVRFEFPRHTFDSCTTAEKVVEALTIIRYRDGRAPSVRISGPVKAAVMEAARHDPAFAGLIR